MTNMGLNENKWRMSVKNRIKFSRMAPFGSWENLERK